MRRDMGAVAEVDPICNCGGVGRFSAIGRGGCLGVFGVAVEPFPRVRTAENLINSFPDVTIVGDPDGRCMLWRRDFPL